MNAAADYSALPSSAPPLVGRERERALLRQHLDDALGGHGSLVLIGGEAGIGKTTLAEAVCREAAEQGALVLVGRCYDLTETPPYGPWVELFGRYRRENGMPPLPDAFAERGMVGAVASQTALFQEIADFFATLAAERPLVLLIDDAHWMDAASLDVLRVVARSVAALHLLLVVTYRSDELTRRHALYQLLPSLVREAETERLDLRALDDAAVRTLVAHRYPLSDADTYRLVTHLQSRADGNALFLGELLRSLEETSVVRRDGERWILGELSASVPPLLRQVIDRRFARLDDESQHLLALASVIGHAVPFAVWAAVADADENTLLDMVARAEAAHIMAENRDGTGATFTHALIREALYEGTRPSQRRRWHRAIAESLAALPQPDPNAVASHFQRAGDSRAVAWLMTAGERAQQAWAWLTAAERFETAVGLMEVSGANAGERGWQHFRIALRCRYADVARALDHLNAAGRLADEADDLLLAAQVRFYRGNIHCLAGNLGQGVDEMEEGIAALAVLSPVDVTAKRGFALKDVTGARMTYFTWLGNLGRFVEAREIGEQIVANVAARASDEGRSTLYGDALGGIAPIYAHQGDEEAACRAFATSHAIRRTSGHHLLLGVGLIYSLLWERLPYRADNVAERRRLADEAEAAWARGGGARTAVPARFARAPVLFIEGHWDELRALALTGYMESGGYVLSRLFAFATLGPLARAQGDTELARMLVDDWLPDGPATLPGNTFYAATILQRVAAAMATERDDLATAKAWLEAHDRWLAWSGAVLGRAERHLAWTHYHRAANDPKTAYQHAEQAFSHASAPRQPLALLAAHRLLGELDTGAGRHDDAARHLAAALALAEACQAPFERALTLLAEAELRAAKEETGEALRLLDAVHPIFAALDAKPALARAERLAAHLILPQAMQPTYPAGLSAREVEVLRLIVSGLSNRDIADRLFLSTRTVQVHVAHIFDKTGAENRAAAAAFALRHNLA